MRRVTLRGLAARKLRLALTALAIVLGVTFVTGTLVLGDTLNRTFNTLVGTVYQHVSFQIRGKPAFNTNSPGGITGTANRKPVPQSIAASVRKLPGVAYVFGSVGGYAQFVSPAGKAIEKGPGRAGGFAFDPNSQLSPYRLTSGRAPTTAHEVVIDKATADKYHFRIGQPVRVLLPSGAQTFTISGIVTFGNDANLAGETLAGFQESTAQTLFNSRGYYGSINVLAAPGADNIHLQLAIAKRLPPGVEVVSGQTIANELTGAIDSELSFLSTALLIFAFISLFVGAFTIFNTFTITVSQRTRELALLRVVGASRRQVFRAVLAEAALTGLAASLVGLGLGVLAALGLKALLGAFGITLPSASLVFEARTPVVALAVGVGITVLSAIIPARRAVRIPPVAALVEHTEDDTQKLRGTRVTAGSLIALGGVAAVAAGLAGPTIAFVALGAAAVFAAAVMLVPLTARPLASALGKPLAALAGAPGKLGRENSMRNPRRTAQTAGALMIGIALVSTIAVLGNSLTASAKDQIQSALTADYVITSSGGFSTSIPGIVSHLPGVSATSVIYQGRFEFRSSLSTIGAVSPAHLSETVNLHITTGTGASAMAAGELLIDTTTAHSDHLHVGSTAPVEFAQTGPTTMRIGGIFKPNPAVGSFITGEAYFLAHYNHPLPGAVLVTTRLGTANFAATLRDALAAYPNLTIQTRTQFENAQVKSVDQLLGLVYVLLALAVIIALIGIVNTLMLSVFERTREIGLLRAVGMKRRQVRAMIRSEAVIIATFGAIIGILIGTGLGTALASSLRDDGVTNIAVPIPSLIAFLILSGLLGLAAATWPARRAANLDVLEAIATD